MSGWLSTKAEKCVPSAAEGTSLTAGGSGAYGSWVEVIASAGANLAVLAIVPENTSTSAGHVQVGVGAAGAETVVATFSMLGRANVRNTRITLPVPVYGLINSGNRVALRTRGANMEVALVYVEAIDAGNYTAKIPKALPDSATPSTLTPSGTAWNNSSWVEVTSGEANAISVYGIGYQSANASADQEFDVGTGGSGSETVIGTLGSYTSGTGLQCIYFPAIIPVAASTRVAIRLRKSGTSTSTYGVSLLYYDDFDPATASILTVNVNDAITVSDVVTVKGQIDRSVSEAVTVSESVKAVVTPSLRTAAETLTVQDRARVPLFVPVASEAITVTEEATRAVPGLAIHVSEAITVSEAEQTGPTGRLVIDRIGVREFVQTFVSALTVRAAETIRVRDVAILPSLATQPGGSGGVPVGGLQDYWTVGIV